VLTLSDPDPLVASLVAALRAVIREEFERRSTPPGAEGHLLTAREAATLLRVDERTLRRLVQEGAVPSPVRLGKRAIRWDRIALLRSVGVDPS
jgi:excisionase family DNA binding protein